MAQITFFAAHEDREILWKIIFVELHLGASPDPWFGDLPAPVFYTAAELEENLKTYPRVAPGLSYFLTSRQWSTEPLVYRHCRDNPNFSPHWYMNQRYGGPSIHFIPSFSYPWDENDSEVIGGLFSDYPYYYSSADGIQKIKRPERLVQTMKAIRLGLRHHGTVVRAVTGQHAIAITGALKTMGEGKLLRLGDIVFTSSRRIAGG